MNRPALILLFVLACPLLQAQSADEYDRQTRQLIADFRYGEALTIVEKGLERFPENPRLLLSAARLMIRHGRVAQAQRMLKVAISENLRSVENLLEAAELQLASGRITPAISLFERVLQLQPTHAQAHYRLGLSYFFLNRTEEAQRHARLAAKTADARTEYRRFYALLLELAGNSGESYRELQKAQQLSPNDAKLAFQLSDRARDEGRRMEALEYLEVAVQLDRENPLYHSELAKVYASLGFEQEAEDEKARAARLGRAFEKYSQALQLKSRGKPDEATRLLRAEVQANPEFLSGRLLLGELYRTMGETERALQVYDQVLGSGSPLQKVVEESAWLRLQQGSVREAVELLTRAGQASPNTLLWQAYADLVEENWKGALVKLQQVEQEYPLNSSLLQLISFCLQSLKEFQAALSYLEKAHSVDPSNRGIEDQARRIRFDYVLQLEESGAWEKALPVLDSLIEEERGRPEFFFHRAFVGQQLGLFEDAVQDFQRGLILEPGAVWAQINLAACLYSLQRYDEAAVVWEKLAADSETPENIYHLGLARIRQDRAEEGWKLVRRSAAGGYLPALQLLESRRISLAGRRP